VGTDDFRRTPGLDNDDFSHFKPRAIYDKPVGYDRYASDHETVRRQLAEAQDKLTSLDEKPTLQGVVVEVFEKGGAKWCSILSGGQRMKKKLAAWDKDIIVGAAVEVTPQGAQPISYGLAPVCGAVCVVTHVHGSYVEFELHGAKRVAACGLPCKPGDRVILEQTFAAVVKNLGSEGLAKTHAEETGVDWDDIGGLEEVKQHLREAIEEPYQHAEIYKRFGKKPCKGILLEGPPGTGKTMLGKAAATALARIHGKKACRTGFIYSKGPEMLSGLVGSSEGNVRTLFSSARDHQEKHGYPAIIFIDEADGILGVRGKNIFEGMERTIVPMFLAEMDGLDAFGPMVLFATNRPDSIDPALKRDGRIDLTVHVGFPPESACVDIFTKRLKNRPAPKTLAKVAASKLFACKNLKPTGALVSGIVEKATQLAIRRAIAATDGGGKEQIVLKDIEDVLAELDKQAGEMLKGMPAGAVAVANKEAVR
jgi:ATP-dependent 26S proteasome regulatory subunit